MLSQGLQVAELHGHPFHAAALQPLGQLQQQAAAAFQQSGLHGNQQQRCARTLPVPLQQMQFIDDRVHEMTWVMAQEKGPFLQHGG